MANENETVEQVCKEVYDEINYGNNVFFDLEGRRAVKYGNRILASHKRELSAKDKEIEDLKAKNRDLHNAALFRDKIIGERDAIIRELADKLADLLACDGVYSDGADCYKKCPEASREMCGRGKTCQLVAKARKIVS